MVMRPLSSTTPIQLPPPQIGLLHAVGNNREVLSFAEDSFLASFFPEAEGKTPAEIATLLAADERIDAAHGSAAEEGQSEQTGEDVNTHFICFCCKDGHLYELDGRKHAPINHGPCTPETLLPDAVRVRVVCDMISCCCCLLLIIMGVGSH
jgi:ubiquitin carboxyl-terminal hydrolase L3